MAYLHQMIEPAKLGLAIGGVVGFTLGVAYSVFITKEFIATFKRGG